MRKSWGKIAVKKADLQLEPTLGGGQSFRWSNCGGKNWIGVFRNKVWILSQESNELLYESFGPEAGEVKPGMSSSEDEENENMLKSYLRLDVNLSEYYRVWSEADPHFRDVAPKLYGVRILNQDVTENVFSFICSSNNRIERITSMVDKLCELYGDPIAEVDKKVFKSFPTVERLAGDTVEAELKKAGFGYRAKFVYESACLIKKLGGTVWLENLKLLPYKDAKKNLMKLSGVGAKVADCICLMSLGHLEAVPVDTHVFQVATKFYLPHLKKYKSVTDKVYNEIGDNFRSLHGPYAGWANTVLAKKGSSSEEDRSVAPFPVSPNADSQPMHLVSRPVGKRSPNRYPRGRPFQGQQQMDGRYPQMGFYPQQSGMHQGGPQGGQRPFGQNSYPSFNSQQNPGSFGGPSNYPTMGPSGSSRPFYAGSGRPNQFGGNGRPNQFGGSGRPNQFGGSGRPNQFGNPQVSAGYQYPGNSPFPGNSQVSGSSDFSGNSPFPGNSQISADAQFPGAGQPSFGAQFPGSTFPMTA